MDARTILIHFRSLNARKSLRDMMRNPAYSLSNLDPSAGSGGGDISSARGTSRSHPSRPVVVVPSLTHVLPSELPHSSLNDEFKSVV
jgi:hypothetical protein